MRSANPKRRHTHGGHPKANGFTLSETLLALFAASLITLLCASMMQTLLKIRTLPVQTQEQLAILQIREIAASSVEGRVQDGKLILSSGHDSVTLEFHNNRIVKRPGYQILLENAEHAFFEQEGRKINLVVTIHEKTRTWQIL